MAVVVELPGLYVDDVSVDGSAVRPALINRSPEPNELGVIASTNISIEIVDVGTDGIDRPATQIFVDSVLVFQGGGAPEIQPGFDGPGAAVVQTADTLSITLDPTSDFTSLQVVSVRVVSQTATSALPLDETYPFTIQDLTPPVLAVAQATAPRIVRVTFDEPVPQGDASPGDTLIASKYVFDTQTVPAVALTALSVRAVNPLIVEVEVDFDMSQGAVYNITISDVSDLLGNLVIAPGIAGSFTGFVPPNRPARRRFDLIRFLPQINRDLDATGDLRKFMAILQDVVEILLSEIDRFTDIIDPDLAPEAFLDVMLASLGNPFAFDLTVLQKRRLASILVQIYRQKGTAIGIQNAIRFFLGVDVLAVPSFNASTLVLGDSELGVDWELGPSTAFSLYSFDIEVDRALTDEERSQIREIVDFMRPAHTHFVDLIEP